MYPPSPACCVPASPRSRYQESGAFSVGNQRLTASALALWNVNDETIKIVIHLDLTGKPGCRPNVESEVEHILFHRFRPADTLGPGVIDVDMTGRTGTGPPPHSASMPGWSCEPRSSMTVEPLLTSSS